MAKTQVGNVSITSYLQCSRSLSRSRSRFSQWALVTPVVQLRMSRYTGAHLRVRAGKAFTLMISVWEQTRDPKPAARRYRVVREARYITATLRLKTHRGPVSRQLPPPPQRGSSYLLRSRLPLPRRRRRARDSPPSWMEADSSHINRSAARPRLSAVARSRVLRAESARPLPAHRAARAASAVRESSNWRSSQSAGLISILPNMTLFTDLPTGLRSRQRLVRAFVVPSIALYGRGVFLELCTSSSCKRFPGSACGWR